jgi:hypothetical protein
MNDLDASAGVLARAIVITTLFFGGVFFLGVFERPPIVWSYLAIVVPLSLWALYLVTTVEAAVVLETNNPRLGTPIGGRVVARLRAQPRGAVRVTFRALSQDFGDEDIYGQTMSRASVEIPPERISRTAGGECSIPFYVVLPRGEENIVLQRSLNVRVHVWRGLRVLARGAVTISPS